MKPTRFLLRQCGLLCFLISVAHAQATDNWYIPKRTEVLEGGRAEFGIRLRYSPDQSGALNSRRVELAPSLRYSPWRRFEIYAEVPYVEANAENIQNFALIRNEAQGMGDVFLQLSYDAISRDDWKIIAQVDQVFPTGTDPYDRPIGLGGGHYRTGIGATALKVIDPLTLFAYIGHVWSNSSTHSAVGKVEPGYDWRFQVGSNLTLSPRVSASLYTAWDIVSNTKLNRNLVVGSSGDIVRIGTGLNWFMPNESTMRFNTTFGVTDDAGDATMSLECTMPFRIKFGRASNASDTSTRSFMETAEGPAYFGN